MPAVSRPTTGKTVGPSEGGREGGREGVREGGRERGKEGLTMRVRINASGESTNHGENAGAVRRVDGVPIHDGGGEGGLGLRGLFGGREGGREGGLVEEERRR